MATRNRSGLDWRRVAWAAAGMVLVVAATIGFLAWVSWWSVQVTR